MVTDIGDDYSSSQTIFIFAYKKIRFLYKYLLWRCWKAFSCCCSFSFSVFFCCTSPVKWHAPKLNALSCFFLLSAQNLDCQYKTNNKQSVISKRRDSQLNTMKLMLYNGDLYSLLYSHIIYLCFHFHFFVWVPAFVSNIFKRRAAAFLFYVCECLREMNRWTTKWNQKMSFC